MFVHQSCSQSQMWWRAYWGCLNYPFLFCIRRLTELCDIMQWSWMYGISHESPGFSDRNDLGFPGNSVTGSCWKGRCSLSSLYTWAFWFHADFSTECILVVWNYLLKLPVWCHHVPFTWPLCSFGHPVSRSGVFYCVSLHPTPTHSPLLRSSTSLLLLKSKWYASPTLYSEERFWKATYLWPDWPWYSSHSWPEAIHQPKRFLCSGNRQ